MNFQMLCVGLCFCAGCVELLLNVMLERVDFSSAFAYYYFKSILSWKCLDELWLYALCFSFFAEVPGSFTDSAARWRAVVYGIFYSLLPSIYMVLFF